MDSQFDAFTDAPIDGGMSQVYSKLIILCNL